MRAALGDSARDTIEREIDDEREYPLPRALGYGESAMRFALEWRDRRVGSMQTPRRFLDYVVGGESLYEQHGADFIGALGWLPTAADEEAARRLLRNEDPDVGDRVALYICPEDADLLCGAITAVIERVGDEIVWRDLAVSWYDHLEQKWDHDATGFSQWIELRFQATGYYDAITNRPKPTEVPQ